MIVPKIKPKLIICLKKMAERDESTKENAQKLSRISAELNQVKNDYEKNQV